MIALAHELFMSELNPITLSKGYICIHFRSEIHLWTYFKSEQDFFLDFDKIKHIANRW